MMQLTDVKRAFAVGTLGERYTPAGIRGEFLRRWRYGLQNRNTLKIVRVPKLRLLDGYLIDDQPPPVAATLMARIPFSPMPARLVASSDS